MSDAGPGAAGHAAGVDALGVRHAPAGDRSRIVSLVPSITELLCALGLADQVVGRTTFCIHPRETVARIVRVGGTKKVRIDRLRALCPTHVVVNVDENDRRQVEEIATFAPHVIVTHPSGPRDNLALYRLLGHVFGARDRAETLCRDFEAAFDRLRRAASGFEPLEVLYLIWREPWMSISRETYIAQVLALAKWRSANLGPDRYPEIPLDPESAAGIDLVLLSSEPYPFKARHLEEVRARVGPGPVVALMDAEMVSWYGSRAIRGLDYLRDFVPRAAARCREHRRREE